MQWWTLRRLKRELRSPELYESSTRERAIQELASLPDAAGFPLLLEFINDESRPEQERRRAVRSLGKISHADCTAALLRIAGSRGSLLSREAITVLGESGDPSAVDTLISALGLDFPDSSTREVAVVALGRIGDKRAVPALLAALEKRCTPAAVVLDFIESSWRQQPEARRLVKSLMRYLIKGGPRNVWRLGDIDWNWRSSTVAQGLLPKLMRELEQELNRNVITHEIVSLVWAVIELAQDADECVTDLLKRAQFCGHGEAVRYATMALERLSPEFTAPDTIVIGEHLDVLCSDRATRRKSEAIDEIEREIGTSHTVARTKCALQRSRTADLQRAAALDFYFEYTYEGERDNELYFQRVEISTKEISSAAAWELRQREDAWQTSSLVVHLEKPYYAIRAQLASDTVAEVPKAAEALKEAARSYKNTAGKNSEIAVRLENIEELSSKLGTADLKDSRDIFKELSLAMMAIEHFSGRKPLTFHCSMAHAYWMQKEETPGNPYYGKEMEECGETIDPSKVK